VEHREWHRYQWIGTFFAFPKEHINEIRWNALQLIHYGFSRDEVYFMPITEVQDYIKIINQTYEEEEEARRNAMNAGSSHQEGITSGMVNM
jgi:hypothetical protein